jgi:anti-anti-sigma regulatory factor
MLRITTVEAGHTARLTLEGKLAHEWVAEVQKAWAALVDMAGKRRVIVDLADVSFVDDSGKELLSLIHRSGSELVGSGPMITELIDEIHRNIAHTKSNFRKEVASLLLILLFLAVAACTSKAQETKAARGSGRIAAVALRGAMVAEVCF